MAVPEMVDKISDAITHSAFSIHLSKAFDTCDHKSVLDKLESYGTPIRGTVLMLFKSYLHIVHSLSLIMVTILLRYL